MTTMIGKAHRARTRVASLLAVSAFALGFPLAMAATNPVRAGAQVPSAGHSVHRQNAGDFISATFKNATDQYGYFWVNDEGASPPVTRWSGYLTPGADTGPLDFYSGGWSSGTAGYGRYGGSYNTNIRVSDNDTVNMN